MLQLFDNLSNQQKKMLMFGINSSSRKLGLE
jgi:hypothetical protein